MIAIIAVIAIIAIKMIAVTVIRMITTTVMIGDDIGLGLGMREGRGGRVKSATLTLRSAARTVLRVSKHRKPMLGCLESAKISEEQQQC